MATLKPLQSFHAEDEQAVEEFWKESLKQSFGLENIECQTSIGKKNTAIYEARKGLGKTTPGEASKGRGRPELLVYRPKTTLPLILMEAKYKGNGGIDQAAKEIVDYGMGFYRRGIRIPLLLAVADDHKTAFRLFHLAESGDVSLCLGSNGQPFTVLPDRKILLQLADSRSGALEDQTTEAMSRGELVEFCDRVNRAMNNAGIQDGHRALLFSSFLIASKDDDFLGSIFKLAATGTDEKIRNLVKSALDAQIEETSPLRNDIRKLEVSTDSQVAAFRHIAKMISPDGSTKEKALDYVDRLHHSEGLLSELYETFHTYGSSGGSMSQYFTPRHTVRFIIDLIEVLRQRPIGPDDVTYDPACGLAGFLIGAFTKAQSHAPTEQEREKVREKARKRLYGMEKVEDTALVCKVNLLLRKDGKSGILVGSSVPKDYRGKEHPMKARFKKDRVKPSLVLMNPPFPVDGNSPRAYEFVEHAIDVADEGAYIAAIVPTSELCTSKGQESMFQILDSKKSGKRLTFREAALERCQLVLAARLPNDLFKPYASASTALVVLRKQDGGHRMAERVLFARLTHDGMISGKNARVSSIKAPNHFHSLLHEWLPRYMGSRDLGIRAEPGFCIPKMFTAAVLDPNTYGDEWSPEAYLPEGEVDENALKGVFTTVMVERHLATLKFGATVPSLTSTVASSGKKMRTMAAAGLNYTTGGSDGFKTYPSPIQEVQEGYFAYVSASTRHCGIQGFVHPTRKDGVVDDKIFPAGSITIATNGDGSVMYAAVQPYDFIACADVAIIEIPAAWSSARRLAMCALIRSLKWRFSFGRKPKDNRLSILPITSSGLAWVEEMATQELPDEPSDKDLLKSLLTIVLEKEEDEAVV